MQKILLFLLISCSVPAFGQRQKSENEVKNVFNTLLDNHIINNTVSDFILQIAPYHFNGDYSRESVFPHASPNTIICVSPISFDKPIYSVLKKIDTSYDSSYYQHLIQGNRPFLWSEQDLDPKKRIKFVKSRIGVLLHKEIGRITYPLFSKDGKTAIISYSSVNRSSVFKKRAVVYILKKHADWQIAEVIDSKKIW